MLNRPWDFEDYDERRDDDYAEQLTRERAMSEAAQTHSPEWHENRRQGIGGSDAAAVLGLSRWRSPLELYAEKVGDIEPDYETSEVQHFGQILEDVVAAEYVRRTGRKIRRRNAQVVHKSYPWMRAHLDRVIVGDPRGLGVLQVKTAAAWKSKEWDEEPPAEYQIQIQHEIEAAGATWGSFAVLIGGNRFVWLDVEPNPRFVETLIDRERTFWACVESRTPPPLSVDPESEARALAALFPSPVEDESLVELPVDFLDLDEERQAVDIELKALAARKKALDNQFKAAIGENAAGFLPDGTTYTWHQQNRDGYTVKPASFRVLRRRKAK